MSAGRGSSRGLTPSERFEKERVKYEASVKKFKTDGYSSSDEDDGGIDSGNVLNSVVQGYTQQGGDGGLGRTRGFLVDVFQSGAGICLICIASVKRSDAVWNCVACYGCFHIGCVQKWSRDSLFQQKQAMEELPVFQRVATISWGCPKCRKEYEETPARYFCYCGKIEDPQCHPWLVPHSCGETCDKPLQPECNHRCLLLCHPGPCPPCPKTVETKCFCGKEGPKTKRCSEKAWSCQQPCGKKLGCQKHKCSNPCHVLPCPPCEKMSEQFCDCGDQRVNRPCWRPSWKCDKICGKPFSCGNHVCSVVCHKESCGDCPLSLIRHCPCGKTEVKLACTQEIPTCNETCGKLMQCGDHYCQLKCHKDKCACLEVVRKTCRCGHHQRELPCGKEYTCETKCKRTKTCLRHPCNRKCCDGVCPPCEKPCGRTLTCGTHKCASVCHRGACYPCPQTSTVACRCGASTITVPCGFKRRTRPPRCRIPCRIPPDCHHANREPHNCHFGECPACKQICAIPLANCEHTCPEPCHSAVWKKIEDKKAPAGPWEVSEPVFRKQALPCPACVEPLTVTCFGGHETMHKPCSSAFRYSCDRPCGKLLACGNHNCSILCHRDKEKCMDCESECLRARATGCPHPCPRPCHPDPCAFPCVTDVKIKCHCGISTLFVACHLVTEAQQDATKLENLGCGNFCPKLYPCGHKCQSNCHPGECSGADACRKKVKLSCPCGRLKKDTTCDIVRQGTLTISCDDECLEKKEEQRLLRELEKARKREEVEKKNREEFLKFQKRFEAKRKTRDRRRTVAEDERTFVTRYWPFLAAAVVAIIALLFYKIF